MSEQTELDAARCLHEDFAANVEVNRIVDSASFSADIRVECASCHEPFRFLGELPSGLLQGRPSVSIDELELHVPIEPEGAKRLRANATYEMPQTVAALAAQHERIAELEAQLTVARATPSPDADVVGERCQTCGEAYQCVWWADDALWKAVMQRDDGGGLICPDCFHERALSLGIGVVEFRAVKS